MKLEKYEDAKAKIYKSFTNVSTFSYKGYDVIIYCKLGRGVNMKFFLNGILVRIRNYGWVKNIKHRALAYIDDVLIKENNGK